MLTRSMILASEYPKPIEVDIPEWGGKVFIRYITADEREEWESLDWVQTANGTLKYNKEHIRARFLAFCLADENGDLLFSQDDIDVLSKQPAHIISGLYQIARQINVVGDDDILELAKNLSKSRGKGLSVG